MATRPIIARTPHRRIVAVERLPSFSFFSAAPVKALLGTLVTVLPIMSMLPVSVSETNRGIQNDVCDVSCRVYEDSDYDYHHQACLDQR